jgi:hypothetical protein
MEISLINFGNRTALFVERAFERKDGNPSQFRINENGGPGSNHIGEVFDSYFGTLEGCWLLSYHQKYQQVAID